MNTTNNNSENSPGVVVQSTSNKQSATPKVVQSSAKNVLNGYRIYTYHFTLAALKKDDVNDPQKYRSSELNLVILKSGGKGPSNITNIDTNSRDYRLANSEVYDAKDAVIKKTAADNIQNKLDLISGFNARSPGRFDMYIDNVEVDTLMAFTDISGTTLPTSIRFDVVEPYSINGFIEALHVTAVAGGYTSYAQASYILKVEFWGYPDDDTLTFKDPVKIPKTERYFVFGFTGVEVEVTERGTRYKCVGVPFNERAFGQPSVLKKPVTMAGNKIKDILEDLMSNLNAQIVNDDKRSKDTASTLDYDEYEVKFPVVRSDGTLDYDAVNEIGLDNVADILKDNVLHQFPDPGTVAQPTAQKVDGQPIPTPEENTKSPVTIKIHPNTGTPPQIQFAEGQRVPELISALIRDSEYIRKKLGTVESKIPLDTYGFFDYFLIKTEITNKPTLDPVSRKPYQKYRFVVIPYKVHYTRIPTFAGQKFNVDDVKQLSLREYNYLYTGQNVDVLNFKLAFNTLYFEAIPAAMGSNDKPDSRNTAGPNNSADKVNKSEDLTIHQRDQNPVGQIQAVPINIQESGVSAGQPRYDAYYALARNLHKSIVDSKTSMLTGEIDIIGDPFYLVTGGIGNYNPKTETIGITTDGEAEYLKRQVLITINFRNPIDILPIDEGGGYLFDGEKVPFSGVYMVTKVINTFADGIFKQRLTITRMPGQVINNDVKTTDLTNRNESKNKKENKLTENTSQGTNAGLRPSSMDLFDQLSRGLPSPGLPGALSNFTASAGGLGGSEKYLLSSVSGITGLNVGEQISNIRLNASGLVNQYQSSLGTGAAALTQAAATLKTFSSAENASNALLNAVGTTIKSSLSKIPIPGSGIGEGAQVLIADPRQQVSAISDSISGFSKTLNQNVTLAVESLGKDAAKLMSGVGDKITNLTSGIPTDPTAIASKFGINPSQLSGLDENLKSKVLDQVSGIAKLIPEDTNISQALAKGISLSSVPSSKFENLPATEPYSTAPNPPADGAYLNDVMRRVGSSGLAAAFGVSDLTKIPGNIIPSNVLSSIAKQGESVISSLNKQYDAVTSGMLIDKVSAVSKQLDVVGGSLAKSVEAEISSAVSAVKATGNAYQNLATSVTSKFGSISKGNSPLDKLML